MRILFIGNSITLHSICSYWPGVWGMAASAENRDYVHVLINMLHGLGISAEYNVLNMANWEIAAYDREEAMHLVDKYIYQPYTHVIVQLGENVFDTNTFDADFRALVDYIRSNQANASIMVLGSFLISLKLIHIKRWFVRSAIFRTFL